MIIDSALQEVRIQAGGTLHGVINIPGDKSITHRALIFAALATPDMPTLLHNWLPSLDCIATLRALRAMGVQFTNLSSGVLQVNGVGLYGLQDPQQILDAGNSGTTLRLLTGILAAQKFSSVITGDASLRSRPMQRIITPLTAMGAKIVANADNYAPLMISGGQKLQAIDYVLPVASAQVKSAILLAGLYATGETRITSPSICRDHTEIMLRNFTHAYTIPGDISSAAFFIVGATIAKFADITLTDIGVNPTRIAVLEILQAMGADITIYNEHILHGEPRADLRVRGVAKLSAITIPLALIANSIDELPIIALAAACAVGTTVIRGAAELRYKESDRIALLAEGLQSLGVSVRVYADGLDIIGGRISGGVVQTGGDHRIAMTFAMAALVAEQEVILQDTHNIATSFPNFVKVASDAGLKIEEEQLCQNSFPS